MNPNVLQELIEIVGKEGVLSGETETRVYECDALVGFKNRPQIVVLPTTTEQVADVVKCARRHNLNVIPRGAGTGLAGGALSENDSLMLALTRMTQIEEIDIGNRCALVQAGVINAHLTQRVSGFGLCFAPDPSSGAACTIGGNIAANSGGPHTLKYGVTVNHTLGIELVTPEGEIVWLGGQSSTRTMDLTGVVVGSEGTFGIVTRAWVKLAPSSKNAQTMLAIFDDFDEAAQAISAVIGAGIIPAALEMLDDVFLAPIEAAYKFGFPLDAAAILLIETDGLEEASQAEAEKAAQICKNSGAREVRLAKDDKERKHLWAARKGAFGAIGRITRSYVTQDGVVPRSQIAPMLKEAKRIAAKYDIKIGNVFHAGDGNLHPCLMYDERDPEQLPRVLEAGEEILRACINLGGSVTGEHGVGIEKINLMELAFTPDTLSAMRDLREVFDPQSAFNPSKVLPSRHGCTEVAHSMKNARQLIESGNAFMRRNGYV